VKTFTLHSNAKIEVKQVEERQRMELDLQQQQATAKTYPSYRWRVMLR
jgi:hypothetical protein